MTQILTHNVADGEYEFMLTVTLRVKDGVVEEIQPEECFLVGDSQGRTGLFPASSSRDQWPQFVLDEYNRQKAINNGQ